MRPLRGFVSLVGAGPGDPELITVKGLRRLQAANVVVYDALANPALLRECRADAELIDVGKRGGRPSISQRQINELLASRAQAGKQVVRLKGGDPFIFGRGGEEAEALVKAGVDWEVVPGVSSAIAVPAYAGIPLTHRGRSSSFAVVTGHAAAGEPERADWGALAGAVDTLVILMGLGNLERIAEQLIAAGRSADTPIAAISQGSTADQETVVATLATISRAVVEARLAAPVTLVVGEVVRLREQLRWFDTIFAAERQSEAALPSPALLHDATALPVVAER